MTIKDQIKAKAVGRLLGKYRARYATDLPFAWQAVRDAAQSNGEAGRREIVNALINTQTIGRHLRSLAEAEVDTLLADDSLDLTELNRIYGDG